MTNAIPLLSENIYPVITSYECPKCKKIFSINDSVADHRKINSLHHTTKISIEDGIVLERGGDVLTEIEDQIVTRNGIDIVLLLCPDKLCSEYILYVNSYGPRFENFNGQLIPSKEVKSVPSFIPDNIRDDLKEAELIVKLSPKASATLSRRILQSMIRDFFGIKKRSLDLEINQLLKDGQINQSDFDVLISCKSIGNDGAHENFDVTNTIIEIADHEAEDLIELIHHFIDKWYGQRERDKQLFKRVNKTAKK